MSQPDTTTKVNSSELPVAFLELCLQQSDTGVRSRDASETRAPGLILTQEDIINIKLYVKTGLALPITKEEVIVYLGYSSSGIAGLEPTDFQEFFLRIHNNTLRWEPLEIQIKQQSILLEIFATQITSTGTTIIEYIDQMPLVERVKSKVGTTNWQDIDPNLYMPFDEDDVLIKEELSALMERIKTDITEQQSKTKEVKDKIAQFKSEINNDLEPKVKAKNESINNSNISTTNVQLRKDIDELNGRIDQLKKDYEKYVSLAFTGLVGGMIGIAITGGIFGYKAENARKERDNLINQKNQKVAQLATGESIEKAMQNLGSKLIDIQTRLVDAEQGADHLLFVWNEMLANIDASLKEFKDVNDALRLSSFKDNLKRIVAPWEKVKNMSSQLSRLFDEAIKVYKQQQGLP